MPGKPAFQFYPGDWRKDPGVSRLSLMARGAWIELILDMYEQPDTMGQISGTIEELSRVCRCSLAEMEAVLKEFKRHGIGSIRQMTDDDEIIIKSKRVKNILKERFDHAERQKKYREKNIRRNRERDADVTEDVTVQVTRVCEGEGEDIIEEVKGKGGSGGKRKREISPAVGIYIRKMKLQLNSDAKKLIDEKVMDLKEWEKACAFWLRKGYRKVNVEDLVGCYEEGSYKPEKRSRDGPNNNAPRIQDTWDKKLADERKKLTINDVFGDEIY